jgi:hypothetical protein
MSAAASLTTAAPISIRDQFLAERAILLESTSRARAFKREIARKAYDLSDEEVAKLFLIRCKSLLVPASYGKQAEKVIIRHLGLLPKLNAESGDAFSPTLGRIEIKVSIVPDADWAMRQIRPHHHIDHYLVYAYSIQDDDLYCALIPSAEIYEQVRLHGGVCHGSEEIASANTHNEYSLQLNAQTEKFFRSHASSMEEIASKLARDYVTGTVCDGMA